MYTINNKNLCLTYSKCGVDKKEMYDFLYSLEVNKLAVAQEFHKDGHPHLHCYIEFKKIRHCDAHNLLDYKGYVVNVGKRKDNKELYNKKDWLTYMTKLDKEPISNFDVSKEIKAMICHRPVDQEERNKTMLKRIKEEGLESLVEQGVVHISQYQRMKSNYEAWIKASIKDDREDLPSTIPTTWGFDIEVDIDKKKCHYWIWSRCPSLGKTTFMKELIRKYRVAKITTRIAYSFQPIPLDTEMLVMDETLKVPYQDLNEIADGEMTWGYKGKTGYSIPQKTIFLIFSNKNPAEIFDQHEIEFIKSRFNIIDITDKKI